MSVAEYPRTEPRELTRDSLIQADPGLAPQPFDADSYPPADITEEAGEVPSLRTREIVLSGEAELYVDGVSERIPSANTMAVANLLFRWQAEGRTAATLLEIADDVRWDRPVSMGKERGLVLRTLRDLVETLNEQGVPPFFAFNKNSVVIDPNVAVVDSRLIPELAPEPAVGSLNPPVAIEGEVIPENHLEEVLMQSDSLPNTVRLGDEVAPLALGGIERATLRPKMEVVVDGKIYKFSADAATILMLLSGCEVGVEITRKLVCHSGYWDPAGRKSGAQDQAFPKAMHEVCDALPDYVEAVNEKRLRQYILKQPISPYIAPIELTRENSLRIAAPGPGIMAPGIAEAALVGHTSQDDGIRDSRDLVDGSVVDLEPLAVVVTLKKVTKAEVSDSKKKPDDDRINYFNETIYPEVAVRLKRSRAEGKSITLGADGLDLVSLFTFAGDRDGMPISMKTLSARIEGLTDARLKTLQQKIYMWYGCDLYDVVETGTRTFTTQALSDIGRTAEEVSFIDRSENVPKAALAGFLKVSDNINAYLSHKSHLVPAPGKLGLLSCLSVLSSLELMQARQKLDPSIVMRAKYLEGLYGDYLKAWGLYSPERKSAAITNFKQTLGRRVPFNDGNCKGLDPELFHPERGASTKEAKAVCKGCPSRLKCLDFAIENRENFGIWGGMSDRERRRLRRKRTVAIAAAKTAIPAATEDPEELDGDFEEAI